MSDETRAKIVKAVPNRWPVLCILTLSRGVTLKLPSMKDMFYVPMQQFMGLSNTQAGGVLSVYGVVQTTGLTAGICICDMFSKRYMTGESPAGFGAAGVYLSIFPGYWGFSAIFGTMAILREIMYQPVLLKTIRLLRDERTQERMLGSLEVGRGTVDVIIASTVLTIFKTMGEGIAILRGGLLFLLTITVVVGVLCLIFVSSDKKRADGSGKEVNKARVAFGGVVQASKSMDIWVVSLNGFTVYCIYCGLTYLIPLLNRIYFLLATAVRVYGMINQYGLKVVGEPIGGFMPDKAYESSAKYIRAGFVVCVTAMVLFFMVPHEALGESRSWILGAVCILGLGAIVSIMCVVFPAPVDKVRVPKEITGAAMNSASLAIYSPNVFAYVTYSSFPDRYPGAVGFRIVFMVMIGWVMAGVGASMFLIHCTKRYQVGAGTE